MVRIHTATVTAHVVNQHAFRDGTDESFPHDTVSLVALAVHMDRLVAIPIRLTTPLPTITGSIYLLSEGWVLATVGYVP